MDLADILKNAGSTVADGLFDTIKGAVGLPTLPPIRNEDQYQNNNAYVDSRAAPVTVQGETAGTPTRDWIMYGGIAIGVIVAVGLILKR